MSYVLGVDLGTTFTAAAVCRREADEWGKAEVFPLASRSAAVSSVLFFGSDATVLVGEAAERRALVAPGGVAREFKRRIGDRTPLLLAGEPHTAHELAARLVEWVVDQATEREGGAPQRIAITHPAAWGEHKKSLFTAALAEVGLGGATLLTEPEAAAIDYGATERVDAGSTVAVYDLGGGTFDAAVLRKIDNTRFQLLGEPAGADRLGGLDFDAAVFEHVKAAFADGFGALDPDDPVAMSAAARLRRECTEAKEALSDDTEVTIPVLLPSGHAQARMVRGELEAMIRPALDETVELLRTAVRSAGIAESDLDRILLVGGSSRIPLVSQLLSQRLGRPVAVDSDPKILVAQGAARAAVPAEPAASILPAVDEDPPARPRVSYIPLVPVRQARTRRRLLKPRLLAGAAALTVTAVVVAGTVTAEDLTPTGSVAAPSNTSPADPADPAVRAVPEDPDQAQPVPQAQPVGQQGRLTTPVPPAPTRRAKADPNVPDSGLPTTGRPPTRPAVGTSTPGTTQTPASRSAPGTTPVIAQPPPATTNAPPPPTSDPPATDPPATKNDVPTTTDSPPPTTDNPPPTTADPPPTTDTPPPTTDSPPPTT